MYFQKKEVDSQKSLCYTKDSRLVAKALAGCFPIRELKVRRDRTVGTVSAGVEMETINTEPLSSVVGQMVFFLKTDSRR